MDTLGFYASAAGRGLLVGLPLVVALRLARRVRPDWFPAPDPAAVAAARATRWYDRRLLPPAGLLGLATAVGAYWAFRLLRTGWEARMPPHDVLVRDPAGQADVPFEIIAGFLGLLSVIWWLLLLVRLVGGPAGYAGYVRAAGHPAGGRWVRAGGGLSLGVAVVLVALGLLLADNYLRVEADRVVVSDYLAWRARAYRYDEVRAVYRTERSRGWVGESPVRRLWVEFADGDYWRTADHERLRPVAEAVAARAGLRVQEVVYPEQAGRR